MRAPIVMLVFASTIVPAIAVHSQEADVIPRELAVALLDPYGASRTSLEIVVGRLPKSVPSDAIPREGFTILGGVEREPGAALIAATAQVPDSAVARMSAHLTRAGWRRAEDEWIHGGFVPSMSTRPTMFCRANAILAFSARERPRASGSLLHATVSYPDDAFSPCATRAERRSMVERDLPPFPTLQAPSGARMLSAGSGGGGRGSREASTRLATTQAATEVAAHYAAQLERSGWTVSAPVTAPGMVACGARGSDAQRRPLSGVLLVLSVPEGNQLEVVFRVMRGIADR